ncbi:MAG: response regulator, partial [Sediminibacterium sp.]
MKRILLVDNDRLFTGMVSALLQNEQFTVLVATSAKEVKNALDTGNLDLIISDLFVPYSNGFELLQQIRTNTVTAHTPVMIMSDVSNEQSIANCYRLGADAYRTKPINVPEFLSEIKNLVLSSRN